MNPGALSRHSVLYRLAHDEWCSHDEADDGVPCDCHLSMIASLRTRLEAAEKQIVTMREARIAYAVESYNAALAGEK